MLVNINFFKKEIFFLSRSCSNPFIHQVPPQYNKIQLSLKELYSYNEKPQNFNASNVTPIHHIFDHCAIDFILDFNYYID